MTSYDIMTGPLFCGNVPDTTHLSNIVVIYTRGSTHTSILNRAVKLQCGRKSTLTGLKTADVIFRRHIFVSAQNGILLLDRLPASGKQKIAITISCFTYLVCLYDSVCSVNCSEVCVFNAEEGFWCAAVRGQRCSGHLLQGCQLEAMSSSYLNSCSLQLLMIKIRENYSFFNTRDRFAVSYFAWLKRTARCFSCKVNTRLKQRINYGALKPQDTAPFIQQNNSKGNSFRT